MTIARLSVRNVLLEYDINCENEEKYSPLYLVRVITGSGDEINPLLGSILIFRAM
jgi:hypothetical protein